MTPIRKSLNGSSVACSSTPLSSKDLSPPCLLNQNPWDVPSYADSFLLADISYNQVYKDKLKQKATKQSNWCMISKSTVGSQSQLEGKNIDDTTQNHLINEVDKMHPIERIYQNVDIVSSNYEGMAHLNCNRRIHEPLCMKNANKKPSYNSHCYDNYVNVANIGRPIDNCKSFDLNKLPDGDFNYLEGEFSSNNNANDNVVNATCSINSRGKLRSINLNKLPNDIEGYGQTSFDLNERPPSEIDYEEFDYSGAKSISLTSFDLNKTPPRVYANDTVDLRPRLDLNKTPNEMEEEFDYFEGNIDLNVDAINSQV